MKIPVLVGSLIAGILASTATCPAHADETPAGDSPVLPNFIVIFCDNLGYGDIEPFGSTLHSTPALNRMAREGRRFTHFYVTAGVCTPSRASLLTGCYAQRVGMHVNPRDGRVLRPVSPHGLHPDEVTIAEVLKTRGYATTIIGKWHLGDQPEFLPTRQGFDSFLGLPYSDDMTQAVGRRIGDRFDGAQWPLLPLMENEKVIEAPVDRDLLTRRLTERALEFIHQNSTRPFFLYFPQAMPGSTSAPFASPAFRGKSRNGPWGDAIEELDWSTGRILDRLVELGIDRRTLVVWTSDNGAPLARDVSSPSRGSNRPLHGRGYTTAEGAFRVPTIMWWPGKIPSHSVCDELVTTMDLLPTFARLAGASEPAGRAIDGHDIRALILAEPGATSPCEALYYYHADQLQAVRSGPWKLFLPLESFSNHPQFRRGEKATARLFNVVDDIGSTRDMADMHPDVIERLTALAGRARKELGDRGHAGTGQRPPGRVDSPTPRLLSVEKKPVVAHVITSHGEVLVGTLPERKFAISTSYGDLEVPVEEIRSMEFSRFRTPAQKEEIRTAIDSLRRRADGDEKDEEHEAVRQRLVDRGIQALDLLRAARTVDEADFNGIVDEIIDEIIDLEREERPTLDSIVTSRFTAAGRIRLDTLTLDFAHGRLQLHRRDIERVVIGDGAGHRFSDEVLLFKTWTDVSGEFQNVLDILTNRTKLRLHTFEGGTAADFTRKLRKHGVLILPELESGTGDVTRFAGECSAALKRWVKDGGVLLSCGGNYNNQFLTASRLLPCSGTSSNSTGTVVKKHAIVRGVSGSIPRANATFPIQVQSGRKMTALATSHNGGILVGIAPVGAGAIVYCGWDYYVSDEPHQRILANAVLWATGKLGGRWSKDSRR